MKRQYYSLILFLFLSISLSAQSAAGALMEAKPETAGMSSKQLALLDGHINQYIKNGSMPGGVFLVARKGKIVYYKNFGHTTLEKNEAYEKEDIFRLASMTKAVTTVLLCSCSNKEN